MQELKRDESLFSGILEKFEQVASSEGDPSPDLKLYEVQTPDWTKEAHENAKRVGAIWFEELVTIISESRGAPKFDKVMDTPDEPGPFRWTTWECGDMRVVLSWNFSKYEYEAYRFRLAVAQIQVKPLGWFARSHFGGWDLENSELPGLGGKFLYMVFLATDWDEDDMSRPTSRQVEIYNWVKANQQPLFKEILASAHKFLVDNEVYEDEDENKIDLSSPDKLKPLLEPAHIFILREPEGHDVNISFNATWDREHGLSVGFTLGEIDSLVGVY